MKQIKQLKHNKFKAIVLSEENYEKLRRLGKVNEPKIVQNTGLDNQCTTIKAVNTPTEIVTSVTTVTEDDREELT